MNHNRILFHAAMICDATGLRAAPGSILIEDGKVVAAGSPQALGDVSDATVINLPSAVVIPALVNAHAHLDLSHIGPVPYTGEFTSWIEMLRSRRALTDAAIDASVRKGVALSLAGGTAMVGDIAGVSSLQPIRTLRDCGLPGVSFFEVFGVGRGRSRGLERIDHAANQIARFERGVALGMQPHSPYSCDIGIYRAAAELNVPLATHLAETLDEIAFVRDGSGPIEAMLREIGVWDESIRAAGQHPIDHLAALMRETPFIAAHVNYLDDAHLEQIADWPLTVAYCPRASAYFGHPHCDWPQHRYREMHDLGINVALGTDSIICLNTPDRLSVLDEMRLLYRRDATDPITLLRMATVNGAKALGVGPALFTLQPGATAGVLAIDIGDSSDGDPLAQALLNDATPQWILGPGVDVESAALWPMLKPP